MVILRVMRDGVEFIYNMHYNHISYLLLMVCMVCIPEHVVHERG